MAEAAEKRVRRQFLVPPTMAARLERIAAERGTSASEIVRQAIESYDATGAQATDPADLMELVSARLKDAIRSTRRARRKVAEALETVG